MLKCDHQRQLLASAGHHTDRQVTGAQRPKQLTGTRRPLLPTGTGRSRFKTIDILPIEWKSDRQTSISRFCRGTRRGWLRRGGCSIGLATQQQLAAPERPCLHRPLFPPPGRRDGRGSAIDSPRYIIHSFRFQISNPSRKQLFVAQHRGPTLRGGGQHPPHPHVFPADSPTTGFTSNQATAAYLHRQKKARDGRISLPQATAAPPLMPWSTLHGNGIESGRHVRELNRILLCPACQRNSLASPQELVIILLASPHRKQGEV